MPQPFIKEATNASVLYKGSNKCSPGSIEEEQKFYDKSNVAPLDAAKLTSDTTTMLFTTVQSEVLYWT